MNRNNKLIERLVILNLVLIIIFLISKLDFLIKPLSTIMNTLFIPSVLAIFLYYVVRPTKRFLEKQRLSSGLSTAISILLIIVILTYVIIYSSSIIRAQGESLINSLINSVQNLSNKYGYLFPQISEFFDLTELIQQSINYITNSFSEISKSIYIFASSIGNFFTQAILIPIIMFYILKDDKKIYHLFSSILPNKTKPLTLQILHDVDNVLKQYIASQVIVACVIGLLMFIGYAIIGMPNSLVLSLFSLVTAFIPFLGVILGILPALLISFNIGFEMVLKIIILTIIVQQLEGNIITPNITGNQLNMHPLTTILVVTLSVYFGGFFAAFVAVPIYNILKVIVKNFYDYYNDKYNFNIID